MAPDFDVIAFNLGIPYSHPFGHRGFSHSLLFAALLAGTGAALLAKETFRATSWWRFAVLAFVVAASHGVLDAATDAGLGIGFFIPFDSERYFLPFRPLETSSVNPVRFLLHWRRAMVILANEFRWVLLPLLVGSAVLQTTRWLASSRPRDHQNVDREPQVGQ